ncbi:hypothetical protein [Streptosporangium sp. NPDC001681]|uniref:hypothetical protein n=1 Tax=Streptosporangium sp. NPDC001681 TaxID=3154395 RepID=UPI00332BA679
MTAARTASGGLNSSVAVILDANAGRVFMKGLRRDHPRRWAQDMEAAIHPYVRYFSPRLPQRIKNVFL